jgi:hypothetical protein
MTMMHQGEEIPEVEPPPRLREGIGNLPSSFSCNEQHGLGVTYGADSEGLYMLVAPKSSGRGGSCHEGPQRDYLANFTAMITEEVRHLTHQGDVQLFYTLSVRCQTTVHTLQVTAADFDSGRWWVNRLGSSAVVAVGMTKPEHLRNAILQMSSPAKVATFETVGWVTVGGQSVWLHSKGAIGPLGSLRPGARDTQSTGNPLSIPRDSERPGTSGPPGPLVRAKLPASLERYELPVPDREALVKAGEADLPCRYVLHEVHPSLVVGFGAVFSSVVRPTELSVMLYGQTGCQKTSLAMMFQQGFGERFGRNSIPVSWNATANAIEAFAATVHDAVIVIDDFVPTGTTGDAAAKQRIAESFLRGRSNVNGRARCGPDGSLKQGRRPAATPLCTGEDVPQGESLRARLVCCEMKKGCLDLDLLKQQQRLADDGAYARVMAAFIEWLATVKNSNPEYLPNLIGLWEPWLTDGIKRFHEDLHGRQLQMMIDLMVGWLVYLEFLAELSGEFVDAPNYQSGNFVQTLFNRLSEVFALHDAALKDDDPVVRAVSLLDSAFRSGAAHLRSVRLGSPLDADDNPERWGYRAEKYFAAVEESEGSDESVTADEPGNGSESEKPADSANLTPQRTVMEERIRFIPHGKHIGWYRESSIYLLPDEAFALLRRLSVDSGTPLNLSKLQLARRLANSGVLIRRDEKHIATRLTVSKELGRVKVWDMQVASFQAILQQQQPVQQTVCEGCVCNAFGWGSCDRECPDYCPV